MTHNRKTITILGPHQTRHCRCRTPQCFSDDHGHCAHCGYPPHTPKQTGSTRQLAEAIARILTQP